MAVALGFGGLIWGADRFVLGAASIARNIGVPAVVVGLTIVGFGTSAPEMLVSGIAAWEGTAELAVGNVLGSNVANIGLVLGVAALVAPMTVSSKILRRELPILLAITVFALLLVLDSHLGTMDGALLLAVFVGTMGWIVWGAVSADSPDDLLLSEMAEEMPETVRNAMAVVWLVVGLAFLLGGSRAVVWGAVGIAHSVGVSDFVIGLTIVACGTSLPELASTVVCALRKEHDMAVGNVVGSNMFNILGVLALPGLLAPGAIDPAVLTRDFPAVLGMTVLLYVVARGIRSRAVITRLEGAMLVLLFVGYWALLFVQSR